MSDHSLARFVQGRTTYRYEVALRLVREAKPVILNLTDQFGWSWEQGARRLVIERWAAMRSGRRVRDFTCESCSAPDLASADERQGDYRGELCRECRSLTEVEVLDSYGAAAEANFHLVLKSTDVERALSTVIDEAMQLPELPARPRALRWDGCREREPYWVSRGLAVAKAEVPTAWEEILREGGAPPSVVAAAQHQNLYLDHEYTIRTPHRPHRRGVVGGSFYNSQPRTLDRIQGLRRALRLAEAHGLVVVAGAYSTWCPREAIRLEVLGPALAHRLYGKDDLRRSAAQGRGRRTSSIGG